MNDTKVIMFNNVKCLYETQYDDNDIIEVELLCKGDFDGDGNDEIAFFDIDGSFIIVKDNHKYNTKVIEPLNVSLNNKHIAAIDSFHLLDNKTYISILYMDGTIRILSLHDYEDNNTANMKILTEQSKFMINSTCMKTFLYKNSLLLIIGDRKKIVIYASKINSINNNFVFTMICEENVGTCLTSLDYINNSDFIVLGLITGITVVYEIESFCFYVDDPVLDSPSQISTRTSTPGLPSVTRSPTPLNPTRQNTPALYLPFIPLYQHMTPTISTPDIRTNVSTNSINDITEDDSMFENTVDVEAALNRNNGQISIIHTQPKRIIPGILPLNEAISNENMLSLEKPFADSRTSSSKQLQNLSYLILKLIPPSTDDVLGNTAEDDNSFVTLSTYVKGGIAFRKSVIASSKEFVFALARLDGRVSFCQIIGNEIENDGDNVRISYSWHTIYAIHVEDSLYKIDFIQDEIINPNILYGDNYLNDATSTYCCGIHSRGGRTLFIKLEVMTDYNIFKALGKPAHPIVLLFDSELLIGEESSRNFCYANNSLYYVTCTGSIHVISGIKEQLSTIGSSTRQAIKFKPETISTIKFLLESMSYNGTSISVQFEYIMKELPHSTRAILNEACNKYLSPSSTVISINLAIQYVLDELMKQ